MLQNPKAPMNPKETSLMTHPDASMKMYDIYIYIYIIPSDERNRFIIETEGYF